MRRIARAIRRRIVRVLLGVDLEAWRRVSEASARTLDQHATGGSLRRQRERDDVAGLIAGLAEVRKSRDYEKAFKDLQPLVSVRIATYRRPGPLVKVAIASALDQTYPNIEVIVVHDGPDPATRAAVEALGDPRVRYDELPERGRYPRDPIFRWMVAGSPAMNRGADLARGVWIAPLDDDDEFSPDHIERLVGIAVEQRAEMAYGAVTHRNLKTGVNSLLWSDPPVIGQFSFNGAIYLRQFHPLFSWDAESWLGDEPADWNLARRMLAAGVRTATTKESVAALNVVPLEARRGS